MYELLVRSRLPFESNPAIVDALDVIYRDDNAQRAAGACAAKRQRLVELAGFKAEMSAAIQFAIDRGDDSATLTPAVIAEVLRQRADEIDDAIDDCREDHAAHQAASRARMMRHAPLRSAASQRLDQLVAERNRIIQDDDAERRAASMGLPTRFSMLRNVMSEAQIEATEPSALNPEVLVARRRARVAEISPQVEALRKFTASPNFDATLLVGLGFDDLIAARDGEKAAA